MSMNEHETQEERSAQAMLSRTERHKKQQREVRERKKVGRPLLTILASFFILAPIAIWGVMMWNEDVQKKEAEQQKKVNPVESVDVVNTEEPSAKEEPTKTEQEPTSTEKPVSETAKQTETKAETKQPPTTEKQTETKPQQPAKETSDLTGETTYTVQSGDTLYGIAMKFYKSKSGVDIIQQANQLTNTSLRVGQVLQIPAVDAEQ